MRLGKTLLIAAFAALSLNAAAQATYTVDNTQYTDHGHWFLQFQGGFGYTFGNADASKLISPAAQFAVGYQFTHIWALRLGVSGWQGKGGWYDDFMLGPGYGSQNPIEGIPNIREFKWYYVAPAIDVKFNIINAICGYNPKRVFGLNIIAGAGANIAFNRGEMMTLASVPAAYAAYTNELPHAGEGTQVFPVGRVGLDVDFRLSKRISLNLEAVANLTSDHYNAKHRSTPDCYINTLAGIKIDLGKTYTTKDLSPVYKTVTDTTWYDETQYKTLTEDGSMTWNVFYNIRESKWEKQIDNDANAQLQAIGQFLAGHKECRVSIKSYADVETGNPKINMKYSENRTASAVAALEAAGVSESIITAESFGDTIQPFQENDKNRCTIITATGLQDTKQPYTVKKFKTTERQVRIN